MRFMKMLLVLVIVIYGSAGSAQVLINEVQVTNLSTWADQDGDFEDWFELFNAGSSPVSLAGYTVTDDPSQPDKWELPGYTLNPDQHLLIWASAKDLGAGGVHYESAVLASDTWKYILPSFEPAASWRMTGFDDAAWNSGAGGFGYGDNDDGTNVGATTVVYARINFNVVDATALEEMILHMDFDDGFVAYLNGTEIARANVGVVGVPPTYTDLSSSDHEANGYQGMAIDAYTIPLDTWQSALNEGPNILAIQVYNTSAGSSDLSSNAWLTFGLASGQTQFDSAPDWMGFNTITELHTNFKLSTGETLLLSDADGVAADEILIPQASLEHSYAREQSGSPDWCFAPIPTPGTENANTYCAGGYEPTPDFSIESGMFNTSQTIALSCSSGTAEIHYTTDGSIPSQSSPVYTAPIVLATTAVLSARTFSTGSLLPSMVAKNTYMIDEAYLTLPVVSLTTNWENLYDENTGIYVLGPPDYGGYPYFGSNFWEDWERESYIEYFDADGVKQFEGPVGLKIHGGWSRALPQKSFRVVCRDDYGLGQIDYPLIADKPYIEHYKSFNLRNGGNDYYGPRFHDALIQRSLRDGHVQYMGYSPVLCFLNGEYYGMYELRENENDDFCESNTGVNADQVTVISSNYLGWNVISGNDQSFWDMYTAITGADPASDSFYAMASSLIDVENYADYIIAETYFCNGDWGNGWNNTKFWHDDSPGGKWRFILMDMDFGMGLAGNQPTDDYINSAANGGTNPGQIFIKMIQNEEFRKYFINRYCDLVNTAFQDEAMTEMAHAMRDELLPCYQRHCDLWGSDFGSLYWAVDGRLQWNAQRVQGSRDVLQQHFSLSNQVDVTLDVVPSGAGRIHISTIEPKEEQYPWTGTYFNGVPVQITVIANPGYVFDHWAANGLFPVDVSIDQFILNIEDDETFTAYFTGSPAEDPIEVTEFMYHDDGANESGDWIEVHNKLDVPLNLSGMIIRDENYFNKFDFPLNTHIPANSYYVVPEDTVLFDSQYPEIDQVIGQLNFSLDNDADRIRIYDHTGTTIQDIHYQDGSPWPALTDATGRTVEFDENMDDQDNPLYWFTGCLGGSPAAPYDPLCGGVGIGEVADDINWSVYPVPADVQLFMSIQTDGMATMYLTDAMGREVMREVIFSGTSSVDVSALAAGTYELSIQTSEGLHQRTVMIR